MPKYTVIKTLELSLEVEADSPEAAEQIAIETDESEMALVDCQYEVTEEEDE